MYNDPVQVAQLYCDTNENLHFKIYYLFTMSGEEEKNELKKLTLEIAKLESDYVILKDQRESFNKRKEIREKIRELKSRLEKINKQTNG